MYEYMYEAYLTIFEGSWSLLIDDQFPFDGGRVFNFKLTLHTLSPVHFTPSPSPTPTVQKESTAHPSSTKPLFRKCCYYHSTKDENLSQCLSLALCPSFLSWTLKSQDEMYDTDCFRRCQ
jgi:subtilisin-like proprotein convertase family protein